MYVMSDKKLKSVNIIENIDDNYDRDIEKGVGLLFRHFVKWFLNQIIYKKGNYF